MCRRSGARARRSSTRRFAPRRPRAVRSDARRPARHRALRERDRKMVGMQTMKPQKRERINRDGLATGFFGLEGPADLIDSQAGRAASQNEPHPRANTHPNCRAAARPRPRSIPTKAARRRACRCRPSTATRACPRRAQRDSCRGKGERNGAASEFDAAPKECEPEWQWCENDAVWQR